MSAPAASPDYDDGCSPDLTGSNSALTIRIVGLFGILITSTFGGYLPLILRSRNLSASFYLGCCFAAGVVLATGFVHILPDAVAALSSPCLGFSENYPWAEAFAGGSVLVIFALETLLRWWICRAMGMSMSEIGHHGTVSPREPECSCPEADSDISKLPHDPESPGSQAISPERCEEIACQKEHAQYVRQMNVIAIVLESGFIFHSIFVGINFGITRSPSEARSLAIALLFHQGFEGIALGSQFLKAEYSVLKYFLLTAAFVLITPVGAAIGIGCGTAYQPNSTTALGFEGSFSAVSAGILIYNGLVDLILPAFESMPSVLPRKLLFQLLPWAFLFAGYCIMSLIAKWA